MRIAALVARLNVDPIQRQPHPNKLETAAIPARLGQMAKTKLRYVILADGGSRVLNERGMIQP